MELNNKKINCYNNLAIALHWILAILLIFQLYLGLAMIDIPKGPESERAFWFNLHKSVGIIIALFVIFRIIWRLTHNIPAYSTALKSWQKVASKWSHRLLYLCMVVMPLTGIIGSIFSKYPIKFFGYVLPKIVNSNLIIKEIASDIHQFFAFFFLLLIIIHITAALKHLIIDCDGVFERIMFKTKHD
jgi:cytochrome b561